MKPFVIEIEPKPTWDQTFLIWTTRIFGAGMIVGGPIVIVILKNFHMTAVDWGVIAMWIYCCSRLKQVVGTKHHHFHHRRHRH